MKDINVTISKLDGTTLTILEGKTLEPKAPEKLELNGTIESPGNFLERRQKFIKIETCNLIVNRDMMILTLSVNETDGYQNGCITGELELHPDFKKFKINTSESWQPFELAKFIKMNRSFFSSIDVAKKLVILLNDFKAKIERDVETKKDDRANYSIKRAQAVNSNLPEMFSINISIFKGQPKLSLPVEININPDTLDCQLCSPEANDSIIEYREKAINEQLERISELTPELLVIEQ
jgi:hypothetical protein